MPPAGCEFVLARIRIDFLRELNWPGDVVVGTAVTRIGRSSTTLAQAIFRDGVAVATAESVGVLMDSSARRATPLPEAARAALVDFMAPDPEASPDA
jgi:acyl-CoA thioester hydrolase